MKLEFAANEIKIMQAALDKWGLEAQADQTVEECAELIVALHKHIKRQPAHNTLDGVLDEIADVEMMLAQMRLSFNISDEILRNRIAQKFARLNEYLEY